ncbi:nitroreductase [Limosilactobacillus difficilis]|uniref:nitroreductase n=1 Tax=Limosilactobacillus difficilis TaxID=2991838 RepID=UPI0024BB9C09|nr:nitroreductase [Limosilactobacillus difficilis]
MDLETAMNKRHSVRQFTDQEVSREQIEHLVSLAQRSPSWVDSQPWQVYAATGEVLQQIKAAYQEQDQAGNHGDPDLKVMSRGDWQERPQANMKQWGHEIVHHFANYDEAHEAMTGAANNLNFAPAILFITIPKQSPDWSILDAGIFAQSLLLAATAEGLGSIPTYNSVRFPAILHQFLEVPEDERFMVGIEIGYPADTKINQYRAKRQDLADLLHFRD